MRRLLLFLLILFWALPVQAERYPCAKRAVYLAHLLENFGERPVGKGLMLPSFALLEVVASESGSWTLIVTTLNGMSCGVASGQGWQEVTTLEGEKA